MEYHRRYQVLRHSILLSAFPLGLTAQYIVPKQALFLEHIEKAVLSTSLRVCAACLCLRHGSRPLRVGSMALLVLLAITARAWIIASHGDAWVALVLGDRCRLAGAGSCHSVR